MGEKERERESGGRVREIDMQTDKQNRATESQTETKRESWDEGKMTSRLSKLYQI